MLVDRVLDWRPRERLRAVKNFSSGEPFFPGHLGARPVVPPVLIIEVMAQAAGLLALLSETRSAET
jgi:3-hydroxyacyl-[acyl-carrier-protein] dehydratase